MKRVLVGCEYSGTVRDAFLARGFDAMSCDLLPTDVPGPHYQGDVFDIIGDGWDLAIFHPPCTYLCSSGLHWNKKRPERAAQTEEALVFVQRLLDVPIPHIALENPVGCIGTRIRPYDQKVQPWQFGHDASKGTCFWLKNLPPLVPTQIVPPRYSCACGQLFPYATGNCPGCDGAQKARPIWGNQTPSGQNKLGPSDDRWKIRSETYTGIAAAMADQWGSVL